MAKEKDRREIKRELDKAQFKAAREADKAQRARAADKHKSNLALAESIDARKEEERLAEADRLAVKRELDQVS